MVIGGPLETDGSPDIEIFPWHSPDGIPLMVRGIALLWGLLDLQQLDGAPIFHTPQLTVRSFFFAMNGQ